MKYFTIILFLFISINVFCINESQTDSIVRLIKQTANNEQKAKYLLELSSLYSNYDNYKALQNAILAKNIASKSKNIELLAKSFSETGWYYYKIGNYPSALKSYFDALNIYKKMGRKYTSAPLTNIGDIFLEQKDYQNALHYYENALLINQEYNNNSGIATILGNIGIAYSEQNQQIRALDCYYKSITINRMLLNEALKNNEHDKIIENKTEISIKLGNIGNLFVNKIKENKSSKTEIDELILQAKNSLNEGLNIDIELGRKYGISTKTGNLGILFLNTQNFKKSENHLLKALNIAKEIDSKYLISEWNLNLSILYEKTNNYKKSLYCYKEYLSNKEDLINTDKSKKITQIQLNYLFEKKNEANKLEQSKKDAVFIEKQKKQKIIITFFVILSVIFIMFTITILYFLSKNIHQKKLIEKQKKNIEIKQTELVDSLNYSKRLQNIILTNNNEWHVNFPNSFVLFKPKDIVSGDFYWTTKVKTHNQTLLFAAVADCTGHGVPGALLSIVCHNSLNKVVNELNIFDPGKILDETKKLLNFYFFNKNNTVKDGMDISLCNICYNNNTSTIKWAGANNPLYIISKDKINCTTSPKIKNTTTMCKENNFNFKENSYKLTELKPNKQPVGYSLKNEKFTTHTFELNKNETIYLFSDGYKDQFGGLNGKKMKSEKFKEIIILLQQYPFEKQKAILSNEFDFWKKDHEQVDDVCVVGINL